MVAYCSAAGEIGGDRRMLKDRGYWKVYDGWKVGMKVGWRFVMYGVIATRQGLLWGILASQGSLCTDDRPACKDVLLREWKR